MVDFLRNKSALVTGFILSLCAMFVFVLAAVLWSSFTTTGTDGSLYLLLGKDIAQGKGFSLYGIPHTIYSPLLPFLIALAFFFTSNFELAGHAPGILLLAGTIPIIYVLARAMWGRGIGLTAALFTASSGYVLWSGIHIINAQTPSGFFAPVFLFFFYQGYVRAREGKGGMMNFFLSGVALGLLYLTRPEYFIVPPFALLLLWFILRRFVNIKARVALLACFFGGFLVLAVPYITYLSTTIGEFSINGRTNGTAMFLVNESTGGNESLDGSSGEPANVIAVPALKLRGGLWGVVTGHFLPLMKHTLKGFLQTEHSILNAYGLVGVATLAFGLQAIVKRRKWVEVGVLALGVVPMAVIAVFQGGSGDYLVQFFPIFNIIAALGVISFTYELRDVFSFSARKTCIMGAIMIGVVASYLFFPVVQLYLFLPANYQDKEYRMLGQWMSKNIPNIEKTRVLSRKPEPIVYAGAFWVSPPVATSTDALVAFMRRTKTPYVIADSRTWWFFLPQLMGLLVNRTDSSKELILVHEEDYAGERALLYRLKDG